MGKFKWYLSIAVILILVGGWFILRFGQAPARQHGARLRIVASLPMLAEIAGRIGGDQVEATSIIKGASCNHEYEPAAGDMRRVAGGDLFLKAGLGFDLWVDKLVTSAGTAKMQVLNASKGIIPVQGPRDAEQEPRLWREHRESVNPHYWGSPGNVRILAENIRDGLIKLRPGKKAYFTANCARFTAELAKTAAKLKATVDRLPDKRLVSYSAAFPYFYQYFGFNNLITVEGACEEEVSPKRLAEIAALMKESKIKVLVGEAVYPNLPQSLAKETGAKLVLLWPGVDESGDYLKTLESNVGKLVSALQ